MPHTRSLSREPLWLPKELKDLVLCFLEDKSSFFATPYSAVPPTPLGNPQHCAVDVQYPSKTKGFHCSYPNSPIPHFSR